MKSVRYALLISTIFYAAVLANAQNPVKKSSPVPARPITPAPGTTNAPKPAAAPSSNTKRSSPVPAKRLSPQSTPANGNTAQPTPTPGATPASVQTTPVDPFRAVSNGMFNIGIVAGIPQGELAASTNNSWAWGLDVTALFNLGRKRPKSEWANQPINVYMGGSLQYMYRGGKTDTYSYNDQFSETTINSKVTNGMWGLAFVTRAELFSGVVKPFVELTAGLRFFTGSHRIEYKNELYNSSDPADTRRQTFTNHLETSPVGFYGAGGGFRIGTEKVRIELKLMYTKGSTAEYVDLDKIQFDRTDNSILYTTKNSTTDMVVPQLGVSLTF
jgi:hypothetical protein